MNVLNEIAFKPNRNSFNGSVMIKDRLFKSFLIPLLGVLIPLLTGLVSYSPNAFLQFLLSIVFFVFITHLVWVGAVQIVSYLRSRKWFRTNIFFKLAILSLATVLYGVTIVFFAAASWQLLVLKQVLTEAIIRAMLTTAIVTLILTLIYESAFLSAEVDLDAKVMQQLDLERLQAEASVLQNELDPHFLFNCLNTLSYLVRHDGDKAYQFVHKLSNVFKYLLVNKQKELVPLKEEIVFLEDYYFLLRVRFDESIFIKNGINTEHLEEMTVPCTLQVLVENAIKHNFFSEKEPLVISIDLNKYFITVSNPLKPKQRKQCSTKTGLNNLKARYRMLLNKEVLVQEAEQQFLVKVPRMNKA
ncbi:MAG TPA: histidine kinase [Flavisolibacter sp.]|nr:histidine kinase [Flavisolibacter sp.]